MTGLREQLIRQEGILVGLGTGLAQTRDVLVAESKARPEDEALKVTVSEVESKLARYDQMFWKPLEPADKERLVASLVGLGVGRVGKLSALITANENTDCRELAIDLRDCFEKAGWAVAKIPLSGTWGSAGVSGFLLRQMKLPGAFNRIVFEAVQTAVRGPIQGLTLEPEVINEPRYNVSILIGPKRIHYDA